MEPLTDKLLRWYDRERRLLPWREVCSPYRTWVSEVMLQQTRVDTVIPYFERFMARFPSVQHLADAATDDVLALWSGLGYYSRARNMHKAAALIRDAGAFPSDVQGLRKLPGVGEYMAAAIGSIAFGLDVATVDGNIARVMARVHADASPRKKMWAHAEALVPKGRAGDYNQALMDLGARICLPKGAHCSECPIQVHCKAYSEDSVEHFPPPKTKKKVPETHMACVAIKGDGTIWLGKRDDDGLWGGLWELPSYSSPTEADQSAVEKWAGVHLDRVGKLRHVLTHRIVHLSVYVGPRLESFGPLHYARFEAAPLAELESWGTSRLTDKAIDMVTQSES